MQKKKTSGKDWLGGSVMLPTWIEEEEGKPFQAEIILWMGSDGAVLGSDLVDPENSAQSAVESLEKAIKEPMFGRPHKPKTLRVERAEWAEALRSAFPDIKVVCAETPELKPVLAQMANTLGQLGEEPTYLAPGVEPEDMAQFFRAAASLYRSKPWEKMPEDEDMLVISIEKFGLN